VFLLYIGLLAGTAAYTIGQLDFDRPCPINEHKCDAFSFAPLKLHCTCSIFSYLGVRSTC
jgi:hypothetical protein